MSVSLCWSHLEIQNYKSVTEQNNDKKHSLNKRIGQLIIITSHTHCAELQFPAEWFLFFKENLAMFRIWRLSPVS